MLLFWLDRKREKYSVDLLFENCPELIFSAVCHMLHGSETWPVRKENVVALQRAEMRMVRWVCGVKLKDRFPSKELRETRYRLHSISIAAKQAALVWACAAKRR